KFELGDSVIGWGLNFSSVVNAGKNDVLRLQYAYGRGIENYMQDSPVDVGIQNNLSNAVTPILGKPVPNVMFGGELQWGRRENFSDGFHSDGVKVQFAFKYSFSAKVGG